MTEKCPYCAEGIQPTDRTCPSCGRSLAGKALLSPYEATTQKRRSSRTVARIFWVISLLAAVLGGLIGVAGVAGASGAPQEAAAAGIGLLIVVAPYVFARSVDEIIRD